MRIGVIGHGHISRHYFAAAKEIADLDIMAVCDIDPAAFSGLAEEVARYSGIRDFLNDRNVDAVIVSVPTLQHAAVARAVIASGKPLLLEKPATITRAGFHALEEMAHDAKVPTIILFHYARAAEVGAAADYLRARSNHAHVAWHSTFYDPYNSGLTLDSFSLVNTWIDSGINELSVLFTLFPEARLRLKHAAMTPPGENQGTISASAEFEISGPISGMAVFEANWALGVDHKSTRISLAQTQQYIELDHSDENLGIKAAGEEARTLSFKTSRHRLTHHYVSLFPWAIDQLSKGNSNWEFASAVHAPFFDVLESAGHRF